MYSEDDFYKIQNLLKKSNIGYEDLRDIILENLEVFFLVGNKSCSVGQILTAP